MLPFSLFYNSAQDFAVPNIICFHVGVVSAPTLYMQTAFVFARYFYSLSIQSIFILLILLV
jgi:hypothetical protein